MKLVRWVLSLRERMFHFLLDGFISPFSIASGGSGCEGKSVGVANLNSGFDHFIIKASIC